MLTVINTHHSRYLLADGDIVAETGSTILDEIHGARFAPTPGHGLCATTRVTIRPGHSTPTVGESFRAIVGGRPFTTSPVVSVEMYP